MQSFLNVPSKLTETVTQIRALNYGMFETFGTSQVVFAPARQGNTSASMNRVKAAGELLDKLAKENKVVYSCTVGRV